ncbi:DegT/DnrJ/EryC1/StrS family aminotransferase [Stappia indica]|uniref:DegT/DnrJ/EryC1/StrS family aminotransferase n=1 Tax=Stappia indica TaxID=538381 RepID=UPI001CD30A84|nr:DegT/DnrJ/EryC1/StrS family aminotransferase [Stappia indica]MCA1298485.1 DegT/DnrJ/EryC1/StrS family aminotransferase [Stappia indica]
MTDHNHTVMANRLAIEGGDPVRTEPLPWELPGAHWIGEEERALVEKVVLAQSPFRFYGPDPQHMVETLEREWCETHGHRHALAVSSGTAALSIALSALEIGPGDEVLIAGYMWVSCVSAIVRCGAIPRLVDIDETFCMDPEDLKRKINERSRAILLVHMSGAPGHVDRIAAIAREHGIKLVEDCAQAAGASQNGTSVGRFGDIATFSFQLNKNMTAGDGGMVVSDDDALFRRIVALHDLGYARNSAGRLDPSDETCQLWGVGARMSDLAGAMALAQSRKLAQITGAMRSAKWRIREALSDIPELTFRTVPDPDGDSGPFLIASFADGDLCDRFVAALRAEGIHGPEGSLGCLAMREWGLHWYFNIPSLTEKRSNSRDGFPWTHPLNAFADEIDYHKGALPRCDDLCSRSMLLTIASKLTDADVDDIVAAFRKVANALFRR